MQILRHASGATVMLGRFVDATDGFTQETALTIANTDIKLLKHGASSLVDKNSGGATHLANGIYRMSLDSTDTDTLGRLNVMCQPSGARPIEREYMVISANWYDSMVGNDVFQCDVTQWLGTAAATPTVAGVPEVDVTHWLGTAAATPTTAGVPEVDITHVGGSTTNVSALATNVNTLVDRIGTPEDLGSGTNVSDNLVDVVNTMHSVARVLAQTETGDLGIDPNTISAINLAGGAYNPDTDSLQAIRDATLSANVVQLGGDSQSATDLKDFADAGYDPATNKVEGVKLVDTLTAYTNNTPQTGDAYARLGAPAGASLSADIAAVKSETSSIQTDTNDIQTKIGTPAADLATDLAAVKTDTAAILLDTGTDGVVVNTHTNTAKAEIQQEADDALVAKGLDHLVSASVAGADVADNSIVAKLASKSATADWDSYDNTTDALEALADQLASLPTAGPGPWGVVINVKSGGVNIQNADVTATNGSESYHDATNSSGNATFSLPTDDWDFYVYKPNYVQDDPPYEKSVTTHSLSGNNVTLTYDPPGQELTEEDPTMTATFLTSYDIVCHLRDVIGGDDGEEKNRNFKRAVSAVHEDFFGEDGWKESLLTSRIEVQDSYSTGTIAFDLTGGSSERLITLTSGAFPSWAARGSIIIDDEHYRVTSRLSNTTLQLDETFCPTADVASGTSYILYQDSYLLPADCAAIHEPVDKNAWGRHYIDEEDWLRLTTESRIGDDFRFTVMHDDRVAGRIAARFYGYPTESRTLSFLYKRVRKTPVLAGTEANSIVGTIAYTNGSATITGTGTAFSDRMVGSVLRIGDATNHPTDREGDAPYYEEHVIGAVASTTSLTLKTAVGLTTASSIKYRVTDPVSFDRANHLALKKGAEAHYWLIVKSDSQQRRDSWSLYEELRRKAHEQQSKHRSTWSPVSGTARGPGRPVVNVNPPS